MSKRYTLYGSEFSLYSGKARSYLYKKGIPFEEVLSTLGIYKKFIIPRTGVRYIPVIQTPDDEVYQDTTTIIDELESRFPDNSVYPNTSNQKLVSLLLETYGDEWLVIPAMHYRWAYQEINQPYVYQQFGRLISPNLPKFIRGWLGKKLGARFKGVVPMLGIHESNIKAIETSYTNLLADLEHHFQQHDYLLGSRPCIADFGFIGPLYAHLYRDPYPGQLMRTTAPSVAKWVERMTDEKVAKGELLTDDQIPDTLLPVLARMAKEQLPVLVDTDKMLTEWHSFHPKKSIPRFLGEHDFTVEGVTAKRVILPYALWMFKRPVDYYQSLNAKQKKEANSLLRQFGFIEVLEKGLQNRLIRPDNKLEFA